MAREIDTTGLADELTATQAHVRSAPNDTRARELLFHLYCLTGQWMRAKAQLDALADLNAAVKRLAPAYHGLLAAESQRALVFAGKTQPIVFGEPEPWIAWMVHTLELLEKEQWAAAAELRAKAWQAAPSCTGVISGEPFEWLADADPRLGPVLEAILDGAYHWVPFFRLASVALEQPKTLGDLVWARAIFRWRGGGSTAGFIPVRYPATELSPEAALQKAEKTEWVEKPEGWVFGLGQRLFITNQADHEYPLLDLRTVEFEVKR